MARQTTITDEQILDAARAVFLEEGFGAVTSKIARRAGVSEGTIFKRFQTKEELFAAALEIEYPPVWYRIAEERCGAGEVKENMEAILLAILTFHLDTIPRLIARLGNPPPPRPGSSSHPMREMRLKDREVLTRCLKREIQLGRLRPCDSELLASVFLGSMIERAIQAMVDQQTLSAAERQEVARGMLAIFWDGIAPTT